MLFAQIWTYRIVEYKRKFRNIVIGVKFGYNQNDIFTNEDKNEHFKK